MLLLLLLFIISLLTFCGRCQLRNLYKPFGPRMRFRLK